MPNLNNPLWKEEIKSSEIYVDLFAGLSRQVNITDERDFLDILFKNKTKKNNSKSTELRLKGNQLFAENKYSEAIAKYNESACFAENGSKELGLAFANRANCFLNMKMYRECLIDITLAKKSNYPADLTHKLDTRQAKCMSILSDRDIKLEKLNDEEVTLSFGEHEKYIGAANCLNIERSKKFGRHVVTTADLAIGQTLLIEEQTTISKYIANYYRCGHCFKKFKNLIPCTECVQSMFCSNECLKAANKGLHKYECEIPEPTRYRNMPNNEVFSMVLRFMIKLLNVFNSAETIIQSVTSLLKSDNLLSQLSGDKLSLAMNLQLETNKQNIPTEHLQDIIWATFLIYNILMHFSSFNRQFVTEKQQRFLQHLILHMFHIANHPIEPLELTKIKQDFLKSDDKIYACALYPVGCYINHSCVPNVYLYSVDNRLICKVIRPIKAGQQLFRSYLNCGETIPVSNPMGEFLLKEKFWINCGCVVCLNPQKYNDEQYNNGHEIEVPGLPEYTMRSMSKHEHSDNSHRCTNDLQLVDILSNSFNFEKKSKKMRRLYLEKTIKWLTDKSNNFQPNIIFHSTTLQVFLHKYWMLTTSDNY